MLITSWGIVSTFLGFTKSYGGLIAARFFLGLCEGGLLGGMIVYLAMFYRRHEMLYRIGLFYCAAPLSGAFGGLLATGLAKIKYGGYDKWPWIFFIEGIVTVLFGITAFFFMPHTPAEAKFLTNEERAVALHRMKADAHGATSEEDVNLERFNWHWVRIVTQNMDTDTNRSQVRMALLNANTWFCCLAWFFLLIPLYSFSLFLPTIIKALGYTATTAQLLTVPPNFGELRPRIHLLYDRVAYHNSIAAFCLVLITSTFSDKFKARGPFMIAGCVLAIAGYVMLVSL